MKQDQNLISKFVARYKLRKNAKTFEEQAYLDAYTERTDALVEIDPRMAIGGLWDEMGTHQLNFLVHQGLQTDSTILDIGCGTLRAGRFLIDHLNPDSYFGFDLSKKAIDAGNSLIYELGFGEKNPDLRVNTAQNLRFDDYRDKTFDFLLAQSVFSHLRESDIEECFEHICTVMNNGSMFFFTFHPGETQSRRGNTNFEYPYSFFEGLAHENSFHLDDLSEDYRHPRGQRMIKATKN